MRRVGWGGVAVTCLLLGCSLDSLARGGGELGAEDDDSADDPDADPTPTMPLPGGSESSGTDTAGQDSAGPDEPEPDSAGPDEPGPGPDEPGGTTGGGSGDSADTEGDVLTTGADDTSDPGGDDESGSGGQDVACDDDFAAIFWVEDGQVQAPMDLYTAEDANDDPTVAASLAEDAGVATFNIDVPCSGDFSVWGLVVDFAPGAFAGLDPDSYYVQAGGGPEIVWRYGCQTGSEVDALSWQPLQSLQAQPCDVSGIVLSIAEPGEHELRVRNREAGTESQMAAIGAIVVATNPDFDPGALYQPY